MVAPFSNKLNLRMTQSQFSKSKTIKGTRDFHSFHVISSSEFEARHNTLQVHGTISGLGEPMQQNRLNINGFVAVKFGSEFNGGVVTNVMEGEIIGHFYKKN